MKRTVAAVLRLLVGLLALAVALPPAGYAAPGVQTSAEGAALIDVTSGRIVLSKNGDKQMRIASLTKIMTAITAIEHGSLSDFVKVSSKAAGKEGSSIYLKAGEEMSLENLLYGLMLRSGNDAAVAIAEHVGGSLEGFVHLMNEKAGWLGMTRTLFRNPSGLDEEGHLSTANDMAKLTAYALRNPVFRDIVKTKIKSAPNPNEQWDYQWINKNKMLSLYEGADGVKTGYTKLAKRCLVSSATRGGQQFAVVTLNAPDDWLDHRKLLDYGFRHFPLETIVERGNRIEGLPVAVGRSFAYPLEEGESGELRKQLRLLEPGEQGYALGERGVLTFTLRGEPIGSVPLYAEDSPRLLEKDRAAFGYSASAGYEPSVYRVWQLTLSETVRRLFVLTK